MGMGRPFLGAFYWSLREEERVSGKHAVLCVPQQTCCEWEELQRTNPRVSLCGAGLFSSVMRDLANITHKGPKWIILDGDIDPMWIESLNTVMDDNKVSAITPQELCLLINLHLCLGPKIRASSRDWLLSPGSHLGQQ